MTPDTQHDEYQTMMQAAAASYLARHRDQYLGNEHLLFASTVQHLVANLEVPLYMAEKLVNLASNGEDIRGQRARLQLDLRASDPATAVLVDARLGKTWSIPVHVLQQYCASLPSFVPQPLVTP